jgi:signal transduction histidine kinase
MNRPPRSEAEQEGVPLSATIGLVALLLIAIWLSGDLLRHAEGAVIPWPAHGIALATLLSAQPRWRGLIGLALLGAGFIGAGLHSGEWARSLGAGAQLTAQAGLVTLLHQWLSGDRHPLGGTLSYWYLGVAIVLGSIPTNILTAIGVGILGPERLPGFSLALWWVAAASSMASIAPIVLAATAPSQPDTSRARLQLPTLIFFVAAYSLALGNAFLEIGNDIVVLPAAVASMPFLVWAGLQYGVRGYAVTSLMLVVVTIVSTLLGLGAFAPFGPDPLVRAQGAWIFVAALAGPTMIFPVALAERSVAEARTRGAYAQLSAIIESSVDLIAAVDRDLRIIAVNPAWVKEFARISGVTVSAGMSMTEALSGLPLDAEDSVVGWRRALGGERFTLTRMVGNADLAREEYEIAYSPVLDAAGRTVGASQVVRNLTLRRQQEAATAEHRRLEALGRLAGGVAHDFNNLMTAVIGYTGLVADSLPEDDARRADLREVDRAATRAGELTQQLLAFARRRVIDPQAVDIGELVRGFTRLLAPLLGTTVRLTVTIHDPLPAARVDPLQFEQVLMNLAVNARDAMPMGGELTVSVAPTSTISGDRVRLTVRDTGTGMPPEVLEKIWEPFFTTKPLGRGTGLGLATVHGIVHQAGGEIAVESTVGVGTAFHVTLPPANYDVVAS